MDHRDIRPSLAWGPLCHAVRDLLWATPGPDCGFRPGVYRDFPRSHRPPSQSGSFPFCYAGRPWPRTAPLRCALATFATGHAGAVPVLVPPYLTPARVDKVDKVDNFVDNFVDTCARNAQKDYKPRRLMWERGRTGWTSSGYMATGPGAAARVVRRRDVLIAHVWKTHPQIPRGSASGNLRKAANLTDAGASCHSGRKDPLTDQYGALMPCGGKK